MNIIITLTLLAASKNFVLTETKVPAKELHTSPTNSVKFDPNMNSLWRLHVQNLDQVVNDNRSAAFRPSISLTRIAKSLNYGVDPFFSKGYFEPFETRPKPITLVAFRKNGLQNTRRQSTKVKSEKSSEAAELQSPYNDIGHFWQDDLGSWK